MYTEERAKEVRRRVRENGERITVVCAEMGMNYENFLRWCRRNSFKVHTKASRAKAVLLPRPSYTLGEKVERIRIPRKGSKAGAIVGDFKRGKLTPPEIALKHGVCYAYVIRLRKLSGLNPPAGKGRNIKNPLHVRKGSERLKERNEGILSDLAAGLKIKDVANKYKVSRQTAINVRSRLSS